MSRKSDSPWPPKGKELTIEQRRELTKYAEGKGIVLKGLRRTDVDIDFMKEVIDRAESMLKLFPELRGSIERPFTIKVVNGIENETYAETSLTWTNIIRLNANAFRSKAALEEDYRKKVEERWFVQGTDYTAIIIHETGHMFQSIHHLKNEQIIEIASRCTGIQDRKTLFNYLKDNLSEYSGNYKNGTEIISEIFADYFGSDGPSELSKRFMDELMKTGGDLDDN